MKKIVLFFCLLVIFASCGTNTPHNLTEKEKAVLDTLQKQLTCQISIGSSKDLLRFTKPYDFEITLSNVIINKDSLEFWAQYVEQKYYPYLSDKERYQNLIITFETKSEGNVVVGSDFSYTFNLDEQEK